LTQVAPESEWSTTQVPRLPAEITHDVLGNGLTYFVQENREPKARAELFLIVGFGSLVEEEEERGIAHIIEHLGFSATKAYENHAIVKFLESIGAPFGACQNAYTTFDRTVYTLHIPTDKDEILTESLTVLREFAFYTRIADEDLEKERKVVLEEWRESKSAQGRLFESYIGALTKGCKYCERLPIGKEDVIRNVKAETLRAFYAKFYHPAHMAVVAVGDFDGAVVVKTIKELFDISPQDMSPLPRVPVAEVPERPKYVVPETKGVVVASSTDSELSMAQGMIDCKRERLPAKSLFDFRRRLCEDLFHKALGNRLLKLILEPRGPRNFFMVSTETGEPIPPLMPMSIQMAPLPGRMRYAIQEIARELERVKRLGFHETEISRGKRAVLAEFEEQYIERDQRPSESLAEGYVGLFLDDSPAPGIAQLAQVAVTVMPSITCEEVSAVAGQFSFEENVVVKIATPPFSLWNLMYTGWGLLQACWHLTLPRPKMDLPNDEEVAALLRGVQAETLEQWPEDEDDVDTRLQRKFDACKGQRLALLGGVAEGEGTAASSKVRIVNATGVPRPVRNGAAAMDDGGEAVPLGEEFFLQNGIRVFLKDTDLFDDEILLRGRRWGGLTQHRKGGWAGAGSGVVSTEAQVCSLAAMMLGICGLSVESLQECLDGKRCEPSPPGMEAYKTAFDASTSPADLELLLTLVNLMFLCPVDPVGKSRGRLTLVKLGLLANRLAEDRDPSSRFQKRVAKCISSDHPFHRAPSLWSILRCNFKSASAIFNERASTPKEWTFCLVGRLPSKEVLLPLLEKYFGTIPNKDDVGGSVPASIVERRSELEMRQAVMPLEISFPAKPVREEVRLTMVDPKGSTVIFFPIQLKNVTLEGKPESAEAELRELFVVGFLVRMLETRLIEVLRFKRGQVYGASVGSDFSSAPPHLGVVRNGTLRISFECDPAEADELIDATLAELQKLRDGSEAFTDANVTAAIEQDRREFEEYTRKNDFWADTVLDLYFSRVHAVTGEIGDTMALWWRVRAEVSAALSPSSAGDALRALLPEGASSAVITMRPKRSWLGAIKALFGRGDDGGNTKKIKSE
jgi:predicted Zn-dependent peptidase